MRITDFGCADLVEPAFRTKEITGNPGGAGVQKGTQMYRAPELFLGDEEYGTAVDMWTLGCIVAEIFSGYDLFWEDGYSNDDQLNR